MAWVLLFLLGMLAVATASTADGQQRQYYPGCNPSELAEILNHCKDVKPLLEARNECCELLGERGECLCPRIEQLIKLGVPLQGLCNGYSACSGPWASSGAGAGASLIGNEPCTPPDKGTVYTCERVAYALPHQAKKCLSYLAEQRDKSGCFAEALVRLGIKNANVLDKLCWG